LIVFYATSLGGPLAHWVGGGFDDVRDHFRGYEGGYADTLKEYLETSHIWQGDPTILDGSFTFLVHNADTPVVTVNGSTPEVLTPSKIVARGPELAAEPLFLVGRVRSYRRRGGSSAFDYSVSEMMIGDKDSSMVVYCGVGGTPEAADVEWKPGDVFVGLGVVTALGRTRLPTGREVDTAYFTAEQDIESDVGGLEPGLEDAVASFRHS
jgi:hypothetical protein